MATTTEPTAATPATTPAEVTFPVTGMTCASCVRRIEKALNKVEGVVEASVNLATEKARVVYDPVAASPAQLRGAVEKAGYGVRDVPGPSPTTSSGMVAPAARAAASADTAEPAAGEVTLPIEGMTCASCVRRIEKALSRVDGVQEASVNLATEKAHVVFDPAIANLERLRTAVEKAGYRAGDPPAHLATSGTSPAPAALDASAVTDSPQDAHERERQHEIDDLKRKWSISLAAGLAMMALSFVPLNVPMDVIAPVLLIVATAIQFWAGAPMYRAAWAAARHGGTNMNTLIAVGTSVAYAYSAFVTLWPRLAMQWGFPNPQHLYFETAVIIIALILLGRWLEARSKKQTSAAIKALMGLQAKTARVIRNGRTSRSSRWSSATWCAFGLVRRCPPTGLSRRAVRRSTRAC
jgi:Cu+-exporting ATPase